MPVVTHSFIMSNTRAMLFTTIDGYVSAVWCVYVCMHVCMYKMIVDQISYYI